MFRRGFWPVAGHVEVPKSGYVKALDTKQYKAARRIKESQRELKRNEKKAKEKIQI